MNVLQILIFCSPIFYMKMKKIYEYHIRHIHMQIRYATIYGMLYRDMETSMSVCVSSLLNSANVTLRVHACVLALTCTCMLTYT